MSGTLRRFGLVSSLILAPAWAQDVVPVLVRSDDIAVLRVQSPQQIRTAFRVTNLGAVLGDERGEVLRQRLTGLLFGHAPEGVENPVRELLLRLLDADVSIEIGVGTAAGDGAAEGLDAGLVLTPRTGVDALALAREITAVVRGKGISLGKIDVQGREVATIQVGTGAVTLPFEFDGRLIAIAGDDLDAAIMRRLGPTDVAAWTPPDDDSRNAAVALHVDLRPLARMAVADTNDANRDALFEALGLASLESLRVLVRTAGPNVEFESRVQFAEGGPRGFFAAFFPPLGEPPLLGYFAGEDSVDWFAGKFDTEALARACFQVMACFDGMFGQEEKGREAAEAAARAQAQELFDFDLETELGGSLGKDFFLADAHAFLPQVPRADLRTDRGSPDWDPGFCFVLAVRDTESFRGVFAKLLESSASSFLGMKGGPEEIDGLTIYGSNNLLQAYELPNWFLGGGRRADELLVAAAVRARGRRATGEPWAMPAVLQRVRSRFPAGFSGCGVLDVGSVASVVLLQATGFGLLDDDFIRDDDWRALIAEIREPLEQVELDRAVLSTGYSDSAYTLRVHW